MTADPKEPKAEAVARVGMLYLSIRKESSQKSQTSSDKSIKETATINGPRNTSRKILYRELTLTLIGRPHHSESKGSRVR